MCFKMFCVLAGICIGGAWVDPESFVREGPTLTMLFFIYFFVWYGEGESKYHYKRAIIGPPGKRH